MNIYNLIDIYLLNQSPFTYFDFYHPNIGIRLDSKNICSSLKVSKAIDILSLEMDNIEGKKVLLSQGINIFNSSSPFYDDICFQFESPNGKDVPLKERLLLYYPNITICDDGCENKGIDLEKYEAICECTFSSILNNNLINNAITGEMFDILQEMNIGVVKCYKDVFKFEYFKKNIGSILILILIFIQIILNVIYFRKKVLKIRKFTFSLINSYFLNLNQIVNEIYKISSNENYNKFNNKNERHINKSNPQKKNIKNKKNKKFSKISNNNQNIISQNSKSHILSKMNLNIKDNTLSNNPIINKNNIINKKMKYKVFDEMNYSLPYKELKNDMKKSYDDMEYEEALIENRRKFCKIYKDTLINKHIILNIIFEDDKYKPRTLKYIILILSINLYFVINGLFYSESYIGKLYQINEKEAFFSFN